MGARGPKKKPTKAKLAEGTHKKCRDGDPEAEPQPEIGLPDPPPYLGAIGRDKWDEYGPSLVAMGCLSMVDRDLFGLWCSAWDEWYLAAVLVQEEGMVATSEKGGSYQHPAVGIRNKAAAKIQQLGAKFGMTPSDRSGMQVVPPTKGAAGDDEASAAMLA